jgi:hypothetical protein
VDSEVLSSKDYILFESLSTNLKLSSTQRYQVLDSLKGYKVRNGKDLNFLKNYLSKKGTSKTENKKYLEEIIKKLEEDAHED